MEYLSFKHKANPVSITYLMMMALCVCLAACSPTFMGNNAVCQSNCTIGSGVQGVRVFVEPDAGDQIITDAIIHATTSVWLEIYLLTDQKIIRALETVAHRGIDVRVMLEPDPYGGGSPTKTIDLLSAAGMKIQNTNPSFALTHEKGMVIDSSTAYIMTANFTLSALGGSSSVTNREYGIIDANQQDVQAVMNIFYADWNHTDVQLNAPNLVISPINSRQAFTSLINRAHNSLLIEAEEMQDSLLEQALINAAKRGVRVQVILPTASSSSADSNSAGIDTIKRGDVYVREDTRLYMHAKIIVVDGQVAFVGSENISTASLENNRELGIIISDSDVLSILQQTFQQDWNDSL